MDQSVVKIKHGEEYITLNVLLKITGIIDTGGMAKWYLANYRVLVNNEEENRRGRKLYPGDIVIADGKQFVIE